MASPGYNKLNQYPHPMESYSTSILIWFFYTQGKFAKLKLNQSPPPQTRCCKIISVYIREHVRNVTPISLFAFVIWKQIFLLHYMDLVLICNIWTLKHQSLYFPKAKHAKVIRKSPFPQVPFTKSCKLGLLHIFKRQWQFCHSCNIPSQYWFRQCDTWCTAIS